MGVWAAAPAHAVSSGQALVELSLGAGFLCLMLLAVWQIGTVFKNFIDISEAARSGARAAALSGAPVATGDTASFNNAVEKGSSQRPTLGRLHLLEVVSRRLPGRVGDGRHDPRAVDPLGKPHAKGEGNRHGAVHAQPLRRGHHVGHPEA